jgi:hypothetical protein
MKVIIAGSRDITDPSLIPLAVANAAAMKGIFITEVVCGKARGVDTLGEAWAKANGITVKPFPAKWVVDGKLHRGAGHVRNAQMGKYADALIALWDGYSNGTGNMIDIMHRHNKPYYVHRVESVKQEAFSIYAPNSI